MAKTGNFLLGAVLGGIVGAATALLLTPASGNRMRDQVRDYVEKVKQQVNQAAQDKRTELKGELTDLRAPQPPQA